MPQQITLPVQQIPLPVFSVVRVALSVVFYAMYCRLQFVRLYFFFCPLYCLSLFDLRLLISTPVSSYVSYMFIQSIEYTIVRAGIKLIIHSGDINLVHYQTAMYHTIVTLTTKQGSKEQRTPQRQIQIYLIVILNKYPCL